jgi:hypothetical protein
MESSFDWEIGQIPKGWVRDYGAPRVVNGDFRAGVMAAVCPPPHPPRSGGAPADLCMYQFHYDQRVKVRIWLDWFVKECDE